MSLLFLLWLVASPANEQLAATNALITLFFGLIGLAGAIFGVAVFIVRTKDMQALRPQIDKLPVVEATMNDIRADVGEMKGVLSVIPALTAEVNHFRSDIDDLRARVRDLEKK